MRPLLAMMLLAAPNAAWAEEPRLQPVAKPDIPEAIQQLIRNREVQVIQIRVGQVQPPRPRQGDCVVSGVVEVVWQGDAYRAGDDVTVRVPCNFTPRLQGGDKYDGAPPGGVDPRAVMQATRACVHIRRNGQLAWSVGGRRAGACYNTTGYTPLDPLPLRLRPPSAAL
jgi:hypothetical protein